jgi:anti-sigma factor RsiW
MPCQELVEVITDYLDDALPATDRARFEAHLAECAACRDYVDQFGQTIALAGRVEPERPAPQTRDQLLSAFRDWRVRS